MWGSLEIGNELEKVKSAYFENKVPPSWGSLEIGNNRQVLPNFTRLCSSHNRAVLYALEDFGLKYDAVQAHNHIESSIKA
ncbi:hypothetical protein [Synechococcus sp. O70.1]|uniref:hypothetical protein n=1 Tax=Synechococcus sp. O70.1 TaxID=2964535 RepID=UPI0039C40F13